MNLILILSTEYRCTISYVFICPYLGSEGGGGALFYILVRTYIAVDQENMCLEHVLQAHNC